MKHVQGIWSSVLLILLGPVVAVCAPQGQQDTGSFRFLVSMSHPADSCLAAVDAAMGIGDEFLSQCDWGCVGGDHTCYLLIRGDDETAVRRMLPEEWDDARIVKLLRFTPEQVASFHRQ